jgi:membrane protease YdiL (CAAX protease family)
MSVRDAGSEAIEQVGRSLRTQRHWRGMLELCVGYGLIVLVIWAHRPWQRYLYWGALAWILLVTCLSFDGWRAMGLRVAGFWRSFWVVPVALAAAGIAIAVGWRVGILHPPRGGAARFVATFWGYCIWSFFQQFLMQDFVLLRLLRLLPVKTAVAATAVLFALAHLPNPILTPLTLVWGLAACTLFLRYRNLYTLAVVHAILGVTLAITVPAAVIHNMRVGRGYLTYRPHTPPRLPSLSQP